MYCDQCEQLKRVLATVRDSVVKTPNNNADEKAEQVFLVGKSITDINSWKSHILRAAHQDALKVNILDSMDCETGYITIEWAMK